MARWAYAPLVSRRSGGTVDAAVSKTVGSYIPCRFESGLRHHETIEMTRSMSVAKVRFQNNEFDSFHEATCAALFNKYGWRWEQQKHPLGGWLPDFVLKGDTTVYVECKGALEWDDVPSFPDLTRYEDAIEGTRSEVLLIPRSPRQVQRRPGQAQDPKGFKVNTLGFLYDGEKWSYAELGRWTGRVGFCHSANSWKDRMSGEDTNTSFGDGRAPDIKVDWLSAQNIARGKRVSFFQGFISSDVETWESSEGSVG